MIYGFDGELLAEYAASAAATNPQKEFLYRNGELVMTADGGDLRWIVSDHLGTPRMIADITGSWAGIRRHDYLPFGEDLPAGVGGRTVVPDFLLKVKSNRSEVTMKAGSEVRCCVPSRGSDYLPKKSDTTSQHYKVVTSVRIRQAFSALSRTVSTLRDL